MPVTLLRKVYEFGSTRFSVIIACEIFMYKSHQSGLPVAVKTWWGHQYKVGIICPYGWNRKLGEDQSPHPHTANIYDQITMEL